MEQRPRHPLNQSCFYKCSSPVRLAEILHISLVHLEKLAAGAADENYKIYQREIGSKERTIEEPKASLRMVHKRVANLLARIETPDYLHSAIKRRSYLTNASAHLNGSAMVKIDVRSFFQSARRYAVYDFFHRHLQCPVDVATVLSKLLTVNGHLPTGSSSSPIISYYAYKDMFDEIESMSASRGLKMTCYVDDMAISGIATSRKLLAEVRRVVAKHGLTSHKVKFFSPKRPKVVTGVVVKGSQLLLPNRRHLKIAEDYQRYRAAIEPNDRLKVLDRLVSRVCEAAQIDPRFTPKVKMLLQERRLLKCGLSTSGGPTVP